MSTESVRSLVIAGAGGFGREMAAWIGEECPGKTLRGFIDDLHSGRDIIDRIDTHSVIADADYLVASPGDEEVAVEGRRGRPQLLFDARRAVALRVGEGGEQDVGRGCPRGFVVVLEVADACFVRDGFSSSARMAECRSY